MGQVIDPTSLLIKTPEQPASVAWFNQWITTICNAINSIGVRMDGYDEAEENLIELGLANINAVLGPFLSTLQEAAQLGFLVAEADGQNAQLAVAQSFDLVLTSNGASLFTPTKWLMAMDVNDNSNWGVLQLVSWVQQDLNLATTCVYATKTQTSSSWQVCCGSAVLEAMVNDLNAATQAASSAQTANTNCQTIANSLVGLQASIAAGPVASVAGRTGIITLLENDISGLTSDLAARPTTTYVNNAVSGLQPHSATLDQLAALTLSAFVIAFLGATNATAALTTLGAAALASPVFTGAPKAPTPTTGDNSTTIPTTAFVQATMAAAKATPAQVLAGSDNNNFLTSSALAGAATPQSVAFGSTLTINLALGVNVIVGSVTSNFTLANPTGAVVGYSGFILLPINHANVVLTKGTHWLFPGGVPAPSPASGKLDAIFYEVVSSTQILCSYVQAYS